MAADPVLVDVVPAHEAIPELDKDLVLHAGPWLGKMCGPMRGAVLGIAVFENWAKKKKLQIWQKKAFKFAPNHEFGQLGMTGMTTIVILWLLK